MKTKMKTRTVLTMLLAILLVPATALFASSKEELRDRFKQRYPELRELKQAGTIGETSEGFVDFVKDKDSKATKLVDEENKDRRELYAIVAKETNTTPELVAEHNAKRNHDRLKPGEYYRGADGKWTKKES